MPTLDWEKGNMRYALSALPLIGILIGALYALWFWVCGEFSLGILLKAAGFTAIPVLVTGGIHLDGFCDTTDALSSRAPRERKLEILKDPHIGVFAVIAVLVYMLICLALFTELEFDWNMILLLGLVLVISRSLGGLVSLLYPTAKAGNLMDTMRDRSSRGAVILLCLWLALALAAACFLDLWAALAIAAAAALIMLYVRVMAVRQFGGVSGDLIGYLIQLVELLALAALVCLQKVMMIL
jgi:adenosylcobinamide-GDP ribazoletransferase